MKGARGVLHQKIGCLPIFTAGQLCDWLAPRRVERVDWLEQFLAPTLNRDFSNKNDWKKRLLTMAIATRRGAQRDSVTSPRIRLRDLEHSLVWV